MRDSSVDRPSAARGGGPRRLERRRQRGHERSAHAERDAREQRGRRQHQLVHRHDDVEVVDRPRDEAQQPAAEEDAGGQPHRGGQRAERQGLGHDQDPDLAARDAERAEGADERAPLHHREAHRVVDEEDPDDEGQQAQRGEVDAEAAAQILERAGARRGGNDLGRGRQRSADPREERLAGGARRRHDVDVAQAPDTAGELLGRRDVGHEQALERSRVQRVRRRQHADELQTMALRPRADDERVAGAQAELRRRGLRQERRPRTGEERPQRRGRRRRLRGHEGPERRLDEGIDAEQVQGPAGDVGQRHVALDDGRQRAHARAPKPHVDLFRQARGPAHDTVGRAPGEALGEAGERAARALVGEVDRDDDGDTERDAQDREPERPGVREEMADTRPPEHRRHRALRSTSRPSSRVNTRSASAVTSSL